MAVALPTNVAAMNALVATNILHPPGLSITQRYSDPMSMLCLLEQLGCNSKERFRLLHDRFASMSDLVNHYGEDIDGFYKHLLTSNKNWLSHMQVMMQAFFDPVTNLSEYLLLPHYLTAIVSHS